MGNSCDDPLPYLSLPVGVSRQDLIYGGLEVILYDHHHFFSDSNIGGMRLCTPQKKFEMSPDASPANSRSPSPLPGDNLSKSKAVAVETIIISLHIHCVS